MRSFCSLSHGERRCSYLESQGMSRNYSLIIVIIIVFILHGYLYLVNTSITV